MVNLIGFVLHIDKYISIIIQNYGGAVYYILLLAVFCETGLVITPFLPGDSLLFAAGAFASKGTLDIKILYLTFIAAAFLGDTVNYHIGKYIGPKAFKNNSRLLKKEYLDKTHGFYEKHGGKTIIIARFMPIIRTFAPFVAGIGKMGYLKFISYNITGSILWVTLGVFSGYFFGNIPVVQNNFSLVVYAIVFISILPGVIGLLKNSKAPECIKGFCVKAVNTFTKYIKNDKESVYFYTFASLSLISILCFLKLIKDYLAIGSFIFDTNAINYVLNIRGVSLNKIFVFITTTGNVFSIILMSLAAIIILYCMKKKRDAVFFGISILGVWIFNELLKHALKRPRPSIPWVVNASGFSFPSGHAMIFMGFSVIAIYFILSLIKNKRLALLISILIFMYSLFVGLSRVYLGVHYLSDVFAGWSAGTLWSSVSIIIYKYLNFKKDLSVLELKKA